MGLTFKFGYYWVYIISQKKITVGVAGCVAGIMEVLQVNPISYVGLRVMGEGAAVI